MAENNKATLTTIPAIYRAETRNTIHNTKIYYRRIHCHTDIMAGAPGKKQKREEYKATQREEGTKELPKKKFYRQRAHANPFSDHQLT